MKNNRDIIVINNIKLPINASEKEAFSVAESLLKRNGINPSRLDFSVYRRSIDARRRSDIRFVYSVSAEGALPPLSDERLRKIGAQRLSSEMPTVTQGDEQLVNPPVVVGSGPAGLFAALLLAEEGYRPLIIERGGSVDERRLAVDRFNKLHILDTSTNIQFGAGGAGTFSDGKLITRVNDPFTSYVLSRFIEFGAPSEIKYIAKPHIGTDVLSAVVDNMINRITELGGKILYHTKFLSFNIKGSRAVSVKTDCGEIPAGAVILAIGHSARDTYAELLSSGFSTEPKDFSVGMRIEHLTEDIDKALYGDFAGSEQLGHAEYALSSNTKTRGVYTFCMCPGGEVVAAASEEGGVAVNGMSYSSRGGKNSNSAVLCSIFKQDYGGTPERAIEFQRKIEEAAFVAGGGGYAAPIITVGDFLRGGCSSEPTRVNPSYMNGNNVTLARPESYLPELVCSSIKTALLDFDRRISGFAAPHAVLTGAETRSSAPLRILRNNETRLALGYDNIYPAGEGAGYAGGITSAAIDGIRCAMALINRYKA